MKTLLSCLFLSLASVAGADTVPGAETALSAWRADHGRGAVTYSSRLQQAAEAHARDMARGGFVSHTGSNGSKLRDRVNATGQRWCKINENIGAGQKTLQEVIAGWAGSRGHRKNLMERKVTEFGLARVGDIWVLVMSGGRC